MICKNDVILRKKYFFSDSRELLFVTKKRTQKTKLNQERNFFLKKREITSNIVSCILKNHICFQKKINISENILISMDSTDLDFPLNLDSKIPLQTIFQTSKFVEGGLCKKDSKHKTFETTLEFPSILKGHTKKETSLELPSCNSITHKSAASTSPINLANTKKGEKKAGFGVIDSRQVSIDKSVILNEEDMSSKQDILKKDASVFDRTIRTQTHKSTWNPSFKVF